MKAALPGALLLLGLALRAPQAHAAPDCEALRTASLQDGHVTSAQLVPAGGFGAAYAAVPAFCRIQAQLTPSADSDIRIEVWLPLQGWNGRLLESGNGAFSPALNYDVMASAIGRGFAATASNTGHEENSAAFAVGHPQKIIDFGYRAVHVDVVAAKTLAQAFYGNAVDKAYFQGCSTGGRQAYGAAQHFPQDFDGIIAGAPGIRFTHQTAAELAIVQQVHNDPALLLTADKLKLLHAAVIAACDRRDGVQDGILENPLQCTFDPKVLQCRAGDRPDCLTAPQVRMARQIYAGVRDAAGHRIFAGLPRGTELMWGRTLMRTEPMAYGVDAYRDVVLQNPSWNYLTLNLGRDVPAADAGVGAIVNNDDPDLRAYFAHGGKLLGYQGWSDGMNSPLNHIDYYQRVAQAVGAASMRNDYRLFLVPGMEHCGGGEGTATFDLLGTLDRWASGGPAPERIPAARVKAGVVDRTRPLCAYPRQAVYDGHGSTDQAANFFCARRR